MRMAPTAWGAIMRCVCALLLMSGACATSSDSEGDSALKHARVLSATVTVAAATYGAVKAYPGTMLEQYRKSEKARKRRVRAMAK